MKGQNNERGKMIINLLPAVGANAAHGMRRTNNDKRRAVETLLTDEEWSHWSDPDIARRCAVHHDMVWRMRKSLSVSESDISSERTYTDRYGNERTMNTANIGKRRELIDEDTGEILDEPPPFEVVDPSDPSGTTST